MCECSGGCACAETKPVMTVGIEVVMDVPPAPPEPKPEQIILTLSPDAAIWLLGVLGALPSSDTVGDPRIWFTLANTLFPHRPGKPRRTSPYFGGMNDHPQYIRGRSLVTGQR